MEEKYCGFIGQRPMLYSWGYDEENDNFILVREQMKTRMTALVGKGTKSFISDMSLGINLVGAELALELHDELDTDVRLVCAVPYEKQADKWTAEHRERYYGVLSRANKSLNVQNEYTEDCFKKCFEWVCHYASSIIAVCGNFPRSSAAKRLDYAKKCHISITTINPETGIMEELDRNRLPVAVF